MQTPYKKSKAKRACKYLGNTRVMAVTFKMKNWYLKNWYQVADRESWPERGMIDDELTLMTVHMHFSFAKKDFSGNGDGAGTDWANKWVKWWDELAEYIVKFKVRILTGDFNMALFRVKPELLARSIPANMVASYMFRDTLGKLKIDSTAIFIIGPLAGATILFDENWVLGIKEEDQRSKMPSKFKTKEIDEVQDGHGNVIKRLTRTIPHRKTLGQGFELDKYRPKDEMEDLATGTEANPHNHLEEDPKSTHKLRRCVWWTYEPTVVDVNDNGSVTFSGSFEQIGEEAQTNVNHNRSIWRARPKKGIGEGKSEDGIQPVWKWPEFPSVKQKLVDPSQFDIDVTGKENRRFFEKGAHMPLMTFTKGESRRSQERTKARSQKHKQKAREKNKGNKRSAHTVASSSGSAPVESPRRWRWRQKAPEPGPAAVAAKPGVFQLVLEDHCAPPDASAVCQRHDTDCHAISGEQLLAQTIYFGEFAEDFADTLQEELAQETWHDVSQGSVAQHQDGWQPMYVPNANALPGYLPSRPWGLE